MNTLAKDRSKVNAIRFAVATVVSVKGSAYRHEGAKMFIDSEGNAEGMISGGCLEPDVIEIAKRVIESQKPILKEYDLDEDLVWGLGLGCPGVVCIYIEPFNLDKKEGTRLYNAPYEAWMKCIKGKRLGVHITILDASGPLNILNGNHIFVSEIGSPVGTAGKCAFDKQLVSIGLNKMNQLSPKSETIQVMYGDYECEVFVDVNIPSLELLIFGAGHDAVLNLHNPIGLNIGGKHWKRLL